MVSVCTVGRAPRRGPLTPQLKRSLDTRTKNVPYTIIFKLVPKFKLLHKSEVTVAQGTLLHRRMARYDCTHPAWRGHKARNFSCPVHVCLTSASSLHYPISPSVLTCQPINIIHRNILLLKNSGQHQLISVSSTSLYYNNCVQQNCSNPIALF